MVVNQKIRIGIVGAGPAGLTTALALEAYAPEGRCEITLLDKNKTMHDYPGVEYGIQKRACKALEQIGIKERALQGGVHAREITLYNSRVDKYSLKIKSDPNYTRCVVRQEFLSNLAELLHQTQFINECQVEQYEVAESGQVSLECTLLNTNEKQRFDFDLVIACDGSFSKARQQFFPKGATKIDQGFSCIYMLIEAPDFTTASEKFLYLANGGCSELIMGTNCTLTLFPLGKNRLAYGIAFDHATKAKLWAQCGLELDAEWLEMAPAVKKKIAQLLVTDATPHEPMYLKALDYIQDWDSYKIYLWKMKDTNALRTPYLDHANLIMIGDAAHALMPTIGMGASLAIQDAEMLANALAKYMKTCTNNADFIESVAQNIFPTYSQERVPVWEELIRRARSSAKENFMDLSSKRRFAIGAQIPNDTLSRVVSAVESVLRHLPI